MPARSRVTVREKPYAEQPSPYAADGPPAFTCRTGATAFVCPSMYVPELNEPQPVEEMPALVRRIFFFAAVGSVVLALIAAYMVRPGLEQLLQLDANSFQGQRDKALIYMAGLPVALCGVIAAVQGWSGEPRRASRIFAAIGFLASLAVLLGAGIPSLLEYLKNNA